MKAKCTDKELIEALKAANAEQIAEMKRLIEKITALEQKLKETANTSKEAHHE